MRKHNYSWILKSFFITASMIAFVARSHAQDAEDAIVKYTIKAPVEIVKGESFQIDVILAIQPDWYIYAPDGVNAALGKIETKVFFVPVQGILRQGRIQTPAPVVKDGHTIYAGNNIVMSQVFTTETAMPGIFEIKGKLIYQTCNAEICLPPVTEAIKINIKIK